MLWKQPGRESADDWSRGGTFRYSLLRVFLFVIVFV
jgi:hypothetical protein